MLHEVAVKEAAKDLNGTDSEEKIWPDHHTYVCA